MLAALTPELRTLSTLIGSGRHADGVSVALKLVEGEGVYLPLQLSGQDCGLWLSRSCWHQWLDSTLATDNPCLLAPELIIAMAHWAATPLLTSFTDLLLLAELPQERTLAKHWAVVVAFELEGQQMTATLCDWPPTRLTATLSHWQSESVSPLALPCQSGLVAGWCRLSLRQLRQLAPGDGLRLVMAAEVDNGECWLWQPVSPLIYIKLEEGNKMTIQQINHDIDPLLACDSHTESTSPAVVQLEDVPQTLVMEIGRVTMPLGELEQLAVGQTLTCQTHSHGEVNIHLNGHTIGSGHLLCCDGQWVVRIAMLGVKTS